MKIDTRNWTERVRRVRLFVEPGLINIVENLLLIR